MVLLLLIFFFASAGSYKPVLTQTEDTTSISTFPTENLQECKVSSATDSETTGSYSGSSSNESSNTSSSSSSSSQYPSSNQSFNDQTEEEGSERDCTYNSCTPTCSLPYLQHCPRDTNPCNCTTGTIISKRGGHCVPRQECQKYANCKGDYNASYTNCPFTQPSTCAKPDAIFSYTDCGKMGCRCNSGYLLNEINGKCIKPEECPGGNACKQNETFMDCLVKCPNNYCPVNDRRGMLVCEAEYQCPSGCGCQNHYKRKSVNENICILASDCPPVNCTRPNEYWNSCPEPCYSDYCSDRNKAKNPQKCPYSVQDCFPQCICKQGFYRNGTDICVKPQECPPDP